MKSLFLYLLIGFFIAFPRFSYSMNKDYGLVFFFRSDCSFCHQFAPILKSMSAKKDLYTYDFSLDGSGMPYFERPLKATPEIVRTFYANQNVLVPSVFVVHFHTKQFVRITAGFTTYSELEHQLDLVFKNPKILHALGQEGSRYE